MTMKQHGFEITVASLPEYERLVAEIYCDGLFFALISQEGAEGVFQVETPDAGLSLITRRVELEGFLRAIEHAREKLLTRPVGRIGPHA